MESEITSKSGTPITGDWLIHRPIEITENNFVGKSLSNWAVNFSVGCLHGCRFCYVPETSTRKLGRQLATLGVSDPDAQWGKYAFLRSWNEETFLNSVRRAEAVPVSKLKPDGNRAVMFCSTTDAYQTFKHADPGEQRRLNEQSRMVVRRALELIRDHSTLRVRILTRGPMARQDFDLFKTFGDRLLFGMSLPTLDPKLMSIYEPFAPHPQRRLETLIAAKDAGLHVYVAVAPTPPEAGEDDIRRTLEAVKALDPVTIFHEPINIRADNIPRIQEHAKRLGLTARLEVFSSSAAWGAYAIESLLTVDRIARDLGLAERLRLWPDKKLAGSKLLRTALPPGTQEPWLEIFRAHWSRVSNWPGAIGPETSPFSTCVSMENPTMKPESKDDGLAGVLKAAKVGHTAAEIAAMLSLPVDRIIRSISRDKKGAAGPAQGDILDTAEVIVGLVKDGLVKPISHPIASLNLEPRFQFRRETNESVVDKYAQAYRKQPKRIPPIVIWKGPNRDWVLDGFHRLMAAGKAGMSKIPAVVLSVPESVAALLPVRFNEKNGVAYGGSDIKRALFAFFEANPKAFPHLTSQKKHKPVDQEGIATLFGTSKPTVSRAVREYTERKIGLPLKGESGFSQDDYLYYYDWFKLVVERMQTPEKWPASEIHLGRLCMAFEILEQLLCRALEVKPLQLGAKLKRRRKEDMAWLEEQIQRAKDIQEMG